MTTAATTAAAAAATRRIKLSWLDLSGHGLSAIERLCLEEALLRHDDRSWAIVGTHDPQSPRFLQTKTEQHAAAPHCIVVMGIGGKPHDLLNIPLVQEDNVMVVKRFSGGGTVVLDHNSLWTTWIGRTADFPNVEPFPRPIMEWSANKVFAPTFDKLKQEALSLRQQHPKHPQTSLRGGSPTGAADSDRDDVSPNHSTQIQKTLIIDSKSCANDNTGQTFTLASSPSTTISTTDISNRGDNDDIIPDFRLRENDYVLGERKVGGNAQSIIKDGWLHHTSFLWDYEVENMEYLTLPSKRPHYRGDRSHDEFLVKLRQVYDGLPSHRTFFKALRETTTDEFDVTVVTLAEAMAVVDNNFGSMQHWFDTKCRTTIVDLKQASPTTRNK